MKKAILAVSFGTSYPETRRKTIEACENAIRQAYPEYEVFRAFTSTMVIRSIQRKENVTIPTVKEALETLKEKGFSEVYIQPLHVILGGEYEKILKQSELFAADFDVLKIGKPLLHTFDDYEAVKNFLVETYTFETPHTATVLMGHGSEHYAFTAYAALDHMLQHTAVHIAAVESYPSLESVEEKLRKQGVTTVHLAPFMLVAGDHATNDMASDEEDSWYTYLTQKGYTVQTHLIGLGEYEGIRQMYLDHLAKVI